MRKDFVPRPLLRDRDLVAPEHGYAWRAYCTKSLDEWSLLVATPSGIDAYLREANVDIYAGPMLIVAEWSEPSITAWVARVFDECSSDGDLDRCRDRLRETFQWTHEYLLTEIRRRHDLERGPDDARRPRMVVQRVLSGDGKNLRRFWPTDPSLVFETVRLEVRVGPETRWYRTTVATVAALASRVLVAPLSRPLVITPQWDSDPIWAFLVSRARACDFGSLADARDLLRIHFEECAPL